MDEIPQKTHAYSGTNRIGQFQIRFEMLNDGREAPVLKALFGLGVILHTEPHESGRGQLYIMASDELFEPAEEGKEIPRYRIEMAWEGRPFTNPEHEQGCVHSGKFRFKAIRQVIVRAPALNIRVSPQVPHH